MLKVGDRVRWVGGEGYNSSWDFMCGALATVVEVQGHLRLYVKWDDHADDEPGHDGGRWYSGSWLEENFELASPLSPFDAAVRAYIQSEQSKC